jgi:hypothetical protein
MKTYPRLTFPPDELLDMPGSPLQDSAPLQPIYTLKLQAISIQCTRQVVVERGTCVRARELAWAKFSKVWEIQAQLAPVAGKPASRCTYVMLAISILMTHVNFYFIRYLCVWYGLTNRC